MLSKDIKLELFKYPWLYIYQTFQKKSFSLWTFGSWEEERLT